MIYVLFLKKVIKNLMIKLNVLKQIQQNFHDYGDKENKLYYHSYHELKTDIIREKHE